MSMGFCQDGRVTKTHQWGFSYGILVVYELFNIRNVFLRTSTIASSWILIDNARHGPRTVLSVWNRQWILLSSQEMQTSLPPLVPPATTSIQLTVKAVKGMCLRKLTLSKQKTNLNPTSIYSKIKSSFYWSVNGGQSQGLFHILIGTQINQ